jgi:hypothetical protein
MNAVITYGCQFSIRTHDALKEANLDIQPPGADPTKEKPSSQVLSSENTTADQM